VKRLPIAFVLCALLSACTAFGLAPAQSFDQRLAYAMGTNTAVRDASTSALNGGTISSTDMEYVVKLNDQTRVFLDAAKSASQAGDTETAEGRLVLATNILTQLQAYLRSKN
jgi:hypothetical protein